MYVNYNYSRLASLRSFTHPRGDGMEKSRKHYFEKTNLIFFENRFFLCLMAPGRASAAI
jgi:hypothetical protein